MSKISRLALWQFLWLIPILDGVPMSSNASWCAEMVRLQREEGLVLGMHGVHHSMREGMHEFEHLTVAEARAVIEDGLAVWRAAFNTTPEHFSFPGQWGSPEIVAMLRDDYRIRVRSLVDGLMQRVFHCDDSWCDVFCKSWFNEAF